MGIEHRTLKGVVSAIQQSAVEVDRRIIVSPHTYISDGGSEYLYSLVQRASAVSRKEEPEKWNKTSGSNRKELSPYQVISILDQIHEWKDKSTTKQGENLQTAGINSGVLRRAEEIIFDDIYPSPKLISHSNP